MKRIVFLIIASLLVLGLVLPGCGGEAGNFIKIAVCGPLTDLQGENHLMGAKMARDEINAAGGITVGGTKYDIKLVEVETNEAAELTGLTGKANLLAVIDDVAFCVGGFRTECVSVYRDVAMDAKKIFMNSGAATGSLQFDVVTNYAKYKYWFKATPYNETFLVKSLLKMTAGIGGVLAATLEGYDAHVKAEYKIGDPQTVPLRVEILMEDAAWCENMVPAAQTYLPCLGFNVTGTTLVAPTAPSISAELSIIEGRDPHIIFTAFSGSVGAVYSSQKANLGIPAMTIGINVPAQQLTHWGNTAGACEGEVLLDTWPVGVNVTPLTSDWFDDFVTRTGRYPVYTAATYDAIKAVCTAIDEEDSLDSDVLIAWLEDLDNAQTGVGATTAYYPMPDIKLAGAGFGGSDLYALNATQVYDLYPAMNTMNPWIRFSPSLPPPYWEVAAGYTMSDWYCGYVDVGSPTPLQMPHIAHDTVYGPGYQTGTGAQWQNGVKVGIWPMDLGSALDVKLTDQYGCWNFQYPGTTKYILTIGGMLNIPWDPYA